MIHERFKIMNIQKKELLDNALQQFLTITGAGVKVIDNHLVENEPTGADAVLDIQLGQQKARFWVAVKTELREQNLPRLLNQLQEETETWLLVARYIPRPVKETLKNKGINYLEAAGNCFIRKEGLFFYINDRMVTEQRQPKEGKLWKQAGLKFLFAVLIKPELLNMPYRKIAAITGVALGNIGPFIQELKEAGFVKEGTKEKQPFLFLENTALLQQKWAELFNVILKPKLKQGTFRFLNKADQYEWEFLPDHDFYWGGEIAGARLTDFLQPEQLTLYTAKPKTAIMQQLKLVPDANGAVEIMEKFWNEALDYKQGVVPPLLAYAELINSLDSRNRETAQRIKQKYLD